MLRRTPLSLEQRTRRIAVRTLREIQQAGVDFGLRPYRPERWSEKRWADAYSRREFAYQRDITELGRYSQLLGYLRRCGAGSILDVGCGEGLFRSLLAPEDFERYHGIDIAETAIEQAHALEDERTTFSVGDLPGGDEHFDVVVLNEVLYYFPSADKVLEQIAGLLSPEGVLLTSIWRHAGDRALWRTLDRHFHYVDAVRLQSEGNPYNRRGWRVSMHTARLSRPQVNMNR